MIISLFFLSSDAPELAEIIFSPAPQDTRIARRGKGLVFTDDQGSFQWTKAVKAFAQLFVGTKVALFGESPFELSGERASPAASLDFAVSKPTDWVADLFGGKDDARDYRRIIFKTINSEQKLPGPVKIHLSSSFAEPDAIQIYLDDRQLSNAHEVLLLFQKLGGQVFPPVVEPPRPAERVLSMQSVPIKESPDLPLPWFARSNFFELVKAEISKALEETEVMELLAIEQARNAIRKGGVGAALQIDSRRVQPAQGIRRSAAQAVCK